jgi:hypothetical protein
MGMSPENYDFQRSPAEPFLAPFPVRPTSPGAEPAFLKNGMGLFDLLSEFALLLQFGICWLPALFLFSGIEGDRRYEQRTADKEEVFYEFPTGRIHALYSLNSKARAFCS